MQLNQLIESLPQYLLERVRLLPRSSTQEVSSEVAESSSQGFVLYWMCTAMRVDENPALEALLNWTSDAARALELLIDLNHRYGLDGRDPASYGGILWCLGQFDRPFEPEQAILGTVRPRPTWQHAHLATKLQSRNVQIHYKTKVQKIERHDADKWQLSDTESKVFGPFDDLIVTTPAPQSIALLPTAGVEFTTALASLSNVAYDPCWAVLLTLAQPLDVDWGGAFVNAGAIRWIARNQTKPGRASAVESIVIHANSQFSKTHLEASSESVIEKLTDELWSATGHKPVAVTSAHAHRWRYSISLGDRILGVVSDATSTAHFCGDWSHGSRVEGAFLAGIDAAGKVMRQCVLNVAADDSLYDDMPLFQN